jgi:thymidine kinase
MSTNVVLYIGPMMSGKTTSMYRDVERHHFAGRKTLIVKYTRDKRFDHVSTGLVNHAHNALNKVPCINSEKTLSLLETHPDFTEADTVGIDEIQFYDDAPEFVKKWCTKKSFYMAGLDSDFRGNLFGRIAELLPLCNKVEKLTAVCICGADASYTKRMGSSEEVEVIGGNDMYRSVCRDCF